MNGLEWSVEEHFDYSTKVQDLRETDRRGLFLKVLEICASVFLVVGLSTAGVAHAQTSASVTVTMTDLPGSSNNVIPSDFIGIGGSAQFLLPGDSDTGMGSGEYLWNATNPDTTNQQILSLYQQIGIKHQRIGDGITPTGYPANADIDAFFGFLQAVNTHTLYTGHLLQNPGSSSNLAGDISTFTYIWNNYQPWVTSFALDNEIDFHSAHTFCNAPSDVCECTPTGGCSCIGGGSSCEDSGTGYGTAPALSINDYRLFEICEWGFTEPADCGHLKNEGNFNAGTAFPSYLTLWESYIGSIQTSLPNVPISGPDAGSYNYTSQYSTIPGAGYQDCDNMYTFSTPENWPYLLAKCEQLEGHSYFKEASTHYYVGGQPNPTVSGNTYDTTATAGIDNILGADWVNDKTIGYQVTGASGTPSNCTGVNQAYCTQFTPYPWELKYVVQPTLSLGIPVRFTESNDYLGGIPQASNYFASALWALDFAQWWALNGASGVDFFNEPWIYTDTITPSNAAPPGEGVPCNGGDTCSGFFANPKSFAIKAFNFGGHGYTEPVGTISPSSLLGMIDVYAVGDAQDVYVTAINKTHNSGVDNAQDVNLTINLNGSFQSGSVATMALSSGTDGAADIGGAILGGISTSYLDYGGGAPLFTQFGGAWNNTISGFSGGSLTVLVPAASALLIRLSAGYHYDGPAQIDQNGAQEMFASDSSGNIWHVWQSAGELSESPNSAAADWTGWDASNSTLAWSEQSMSNGTTNIAATGTPAVVKNQDNTLQVFVPTSGDVFYQQQSTPGGPWGNWVDMGSGSNGLTNIQIAQNADDSLSVFGLDSNGNLWTATELAPGTGWHGAWTTTWLPTATWTELPTLASSGGSGSFGGYVVGKNLNGRLEIFAVGKSGSTPVVWDIWQTDSNTWGTSWTNRGAPVSGLVLSTKLQVCRSFSGNLTVFAVDKSASGANGGGYLWTISQSSPSGGWGIWMEVNADTEVQSGFVVAQNYNGRFEIFAVPTGSSQGNVDHIWQNSSLHWVSAWSAVSSTATSLDPRLVASNRLDGGLQIFGVDGSGNVYSNWQSTAGGAWQSSWASNFTNTSNSGTTTAMAFYTGQP